MSRNTGDNNRGNNARPEQENRAQRPVAGQGVLSWHELPDMLIPQQEYILMRVGDSMFQVSPHPPPNFPRRMGEAQAVQQNPVDELPDILHVPQNNFGAAIRRQAQHEPQIQQLAQEQVRAVRQHFERMWHAAQQPQVDDPHQIEIERERTLRANARAAADRRAAPYAIDPPRGGRRRRQYQHQQQVAAQQVVAESRARSSIENQHVAAENAPGEPGNNEPGKGQ